MEDWHIKTTVWVPKEAFESVQRLWKPEFNWYPVPVDRSLPPDRIAFIQTSGPVSPLPPPPEPPNTPQSPSGPLQPQTSLPHLTPAVASVNTACTPRELLSLTDTTSLRAEPPDYFGSSPDNGTPERLDTPSTATEPGSPSTPKDLRLSSLEVWGRSQQQAGDGEVREDMLLSEPSVLPALPTISKSPPPNHSSVPWQMYENVDDKWKMAGLHDELPPAQRSVDPASRKRRSGKRDVKRKVHWQTAKREEAHWSGSKKGFAVRLDINLEIEVEIKGYIDGDITLSAEALHCDNGEAPFVM